MPRVFKVLLKWIVGTIIGLCILYYILLIAIDVHEERLKILKEKGQLPPPRKKVKQYFEEEPEKIDYDKSSLIPIEETEEYKNRDPKLDLEKTRSDAIWICLILWIIIFYMLYKIYYKL